MSNPPQQSNSSSVDAVYAQLNQRDLEEFYAGYQRWSLQQQISALQTRLDDLRQQIAENTERLQEVHPTAIALATLARLQSNGVSNVDLLDRMLEQGELWLDRTMQRLEYFERLDDFISDDYTQWCQHALEGAYDWVDSMLDGSTSSSPPVAASEEETLIEATEEMFLQKLSSDEDVDEESMLETTLKRPAIIITHPEEPILLSEDTSIAEEAVPIAGETTPAPEEALTGDATPASDLPVEEAAIQEHVEVVQTPEEVLPVEMSDIADISLEQPVEALFTSSDEQPNITEYTAPEEELFFESSSISDSEHLPVQEVVEVSPATEEPSPAPPETPLQSDEYAASEVPSPDSEEIEANPRASIPGANEDQLQNMTPKRPNLITRLIEKIWGS